jgi:DNA processing protein
MNKIIENGAIITEYPPHTPPNSWNFPVRNRIISGLSLGTVVIEANERSGSLITAHEAANQGREVFAVPGSPVDPRSSGPNALIRDGANLVTSAQDIIDVLEDNRFRLKEEKQETPFQPVPVSEEVLTDARSVVLSALSADMVSVDTLIAETGLDARIINIILMELAIAGRLERHTGNRVSLIYQVE